MRNFKEDSTQFAVKKGGGVNQLNNWNSDGLI